MTNLKIVTGATSGGLPATAAPMVNFVGDDADYQRGATRSYTLTTPGTTSNLDVAHYAAATISFTSATKVIADSANGLANVATGDTVTIKGSTSNDGTYTVASGGVAGSFTVNEALTTEAASARIKIYKRTTHPDDVVTDNITTLMWSQKNSNTEKIGTASAGTMVWYNSALDKVIHAAGADLQMIAAPSNILRIVGGSGESTRYTVGDVIVCAGFANAVNNLPGYVISAVTVNGSDLDLTLTVRNNVLVAEAAAGSRSISLVCDSIFSYCAAANKSSLGGYNDWRVPNVLELLTITTPSVASRTPDSTGFPSWTSGTVWTSSQVYAGTTRYTIIINSGNNNMVLSAALTAANLLILVRGGTA